MHRTPTKLLTIYTEAALESTLIRLLDRLEVSGYTLSNARGKGSSGLRAAFWEANSNIKVEVLCDESVALKIAERLHDKYVDNYALTTVMTDAEVLEKS